MLIDLFIPKIILCGQKEKEKRAGEVNITAAKMSFFSDDYIVHCKEEGKDLSLFSSLALINKLTALTK